MYWNPLIKQVEFETAKLSPTVNITLMQCTFKFLQVELHVHLDGALRIQTIIELAK